MIPASTSYRVPSWQEPENKERGIGGINAIGRVIYNHIKIKETLGYEIDLMRDRELTQENAKVYDFIHCSFWFQCFRCIRMGIPYILNIHDNNPLLTEKNSDFYNVYSKAIEQSLVTVAQTDQTKEHWDHLAHKILTVPVPIDTDFLKIDDSIEREDYILCVGAVQTIKGHRYLAKACNDLKMKLLVIGNPDDEDEVRKLRYEIDNSDGRITWIDKAIPFDDLVDYYQKCKVFAMTTKMDVPGLVYLEALCCGANVVATEQGDYKSENPKIARCTLDIESIKGALQTAWFMPQDDSGRNYVVNKHSLKNTVSVYEKVVYQGNWSRKHSTLDKSSTLYEMDFSDDNKVCLFYGCRPFDFSSDIEYEFNCFEDGELSWNDKDIMGEFDGVNVWWSSATVDTSKDISYDVSLNGTMVERGESLKNSDTFDRTFLVEDFEFLDDKKRAVINTDVGSIEKYIDFRVRSKMWDLYVDAIETNNVPLELYSWPLISEDFCSELIQSAEDFGEWTNKRHDYYPTHDILLKDFGYGEMWDSILEEYAHPVVRYIWKLEGFDNMDNESFIVKYDLESENFQPDLAVHHDGSIYTFVVALNNDYEGGGTWFPRQKYLINGEVGHVTVHPTVTHRHGAKAVISGVRYTLITFCTKK